MKTRYYLTVAVLAGILATGSLEASTDSLLGQYYKIQQSLSSDSTAGVADAAAQIEKIGKKDAASSHAGRERLLALAAAAAKLKAADLKAPVTAFGELSDQMIAVVKETGAKTNPPYQVYCPMAKKSWLQAGAKVKNPYYGSAMPTCGQIVNPPAADGQEKAGHAHR